MVALSGAIYPYAWLPTSFLATEQIETVSQVVVLAVDDPEELKEAQLSISSVSGVAVDSHSVVRTHSSGAVVVEASDALPLPLTISVCRHLMGSDPWLCTSTIPNGSTFTASDVGLPLPSGVADPQYQLLAVGTLGILSAQEYTYRDLVNHVVLASDIVTVEHSDGFFESMLRVPWAFLDADGGGFIPLGPSGNGSPESAAAEQHPYWRMAMRLLPLLFLIAILAGLLLLLFLLERWFKIISSLAEDASNSLQSARRSIREKIPPLKEGKLAELIVGIAVTATVVYVIVRFYFKLYSHVMAQATHLPPQESAGLAVWMILMTALLGIFIDWSYESYRRASTAPESPRRQDTNPDKGGERWRAAEEASHQAKKEEGSADMSHAGEGTFLYLFLTIVLIFIALFLWFVQGGMYFYTLVLSNPPGSKVPYLGGGIFTLIAIVETAAFFFVTKMTWDSLNWLFLSSAWLFVTLLRVPFHVLFRVFKPVPQVPFKSTGQR
jgi:hypothetical protein